MKRYEYKIVIETDTPKDLEDVLNKEFQKIAGHRNKILSYEAIRQKPLAFLPSINAGVSSEAV